MIRSHRHGGRHAGTAAAFLIPLVFGSVIMPASTRAEDARPPSGPAQNLNSLSSLDPASLAAFRGRPLFAPSRRPPPPPQVLVTQPERPAVETPPPDLRLVGVVAGVDKAVAIVRRPTGGTSLSLKLGELFESWRVDAIGPDRVTLRDGTREATYRLFTVGPSSSQTSKSGAPPPLGMPPSR